MTADPSGQSPIERLVETAAGWPGVSLGPHPYDGVEFLLDDYEFGHAHYGWESLHINFPRRMREALVEEGRAGPHPHFPGSGWTNRRIERADDLEAGRWLLRLSYLYRASIRRERPAAAAALEAVDADAELDDLGVSQQVRDLVEAVVDGVGTTAR